MSRFNISPLRARAKVNNYVDPPEEDLLWERRELTESLNSPASGVPGRSHVRNARGSSPVSAGIIIPTVGVVLLYKGNASVRPSIPAHQPVGICRPVSA